MNPLERNIQSRIEVALGDTPVVLLNGARQTGKSTLVRTLAQRAGVPYFTLDDATVLAAATQDPGGFVSNLPKSVVIDEVQFAPALFPAIKRSVDEDRRGGRFLLTGSADVMLLPRLSESLAGRMEVITLHPFSQGEILSRRDGFVDWAFSGKPPPDAAWEPAESDLANTIVQGGFPEAVSRQSQARRGAWIESYLTAVIQRDVRELAHIDGLTELPRLLALLAARSGGLLNVTDIARGCALPVTTITRYLTLLRAVFLFDPLPAWSVNLEKRLVKAPKVHLVDSGLAAYLAGYNATKLKEDAHAGSGLLETLVVTELRKQLTWSGTRAQAFHFRSLAGQEVDVVLESRDGTLVAIEVKSAESLDAKAFKGLESLRQLCGDRLVRGIVLYRGTRVVPMGGFFAMPISALWADYRSKAQANAEQGGAPLVTP